MLRSIPVFITISMVSLGVTMGHIENLGIGHLMTPLDDGVIKVKKTVIPSNKDESIVDIKSVCSMIWNGTLVVAPVKEDSLS